jgi:hypothetical protein
MVGLFAALTRKCCKTTYCVPNMLRVSAAKTQPIRGAGVRMLQQQNVSPKRSIHAQTSLNIVSTQGQLFSFLVRVQNKWNTANKDPDMVLVNATERS